MPGTTGISHALHPSCYVLVPGFIIPVTSVQQIWIGFMLTQRTFASSRKLTIVLVSKGA